LGFLGWKDGTGRNREEQMRRKVKFNTQFITFSIKTQNIVTK